MPLDSNDSHLPERALGLVPECALGLLPCPAELVAESVLLPSTLLSTACARPDMEPRVVGA